MADAPPTGAFLVSPEDFFLAFWCVPTCGVECPIDTASVAVKLLIALVVFAVLDDVIAFTLRTVFSDSKLDHAASPFRDAEADITG